MVRKSLNEARLIVPDGGGSRLPPPSFGHVLFIFTVYVTVISKNFKYSSKISPKEREVYLCI